MKRVLLRGPALTASGYGVHTRQIARYLLSKEPEVNVSVEALPWGDTGWIMDKKRGDGLIGKIMSRSTSPTPMYDVSVQVQLPNEWDARLGQYNIGVTAGVETDRCNPVWVDACNKMNMVIVPSEHTKATLMNSGRVMTPIHVVPESFIDAAKSQSTISLEFDSTFNFLVFGQVTGNNPENDRKNIFYTLKWLCETFENDKDVGIVVKTNSSRNTKIDRNFTTNMFKQVLNDVRRGPFPHVYLLHGDMKDEEVVGLYRHPSIKALVSATRGEGYGLPILEAAACGLPVIATDWSGHLDFMNQGKFIKLDYTLREIHQTRADNQIFMAGSKWAEVKEDDFKRKLKKFKTSSNIPTEWAKELAGTIQEKYSFEVVSERYDALLGPILSR